MLMAAYSLLLSAGLVVSAPWWLLRMATTARYREGLRERLGRVPAPLRETVRHRRVLWVHAVSVGEVLAVTRLIAELEAALLQDTSPQDQPQAHNQAPGWRIVISTTTRTGQALARERFGAERVFYLPLDLRWTVRSYLRALHPSLIVLAESELWPRLLHESHREGIPVAVVNARISDRSFRRARRVRWLWQAVLRDVTQFLAQSETDAVRLRSLGAEPATVATVGNLKYDAKEPHEGPLVGRIRAAFRGRPVVVAGSTVEGEDELILSAFYEIRQAVPDAVLILAPRHPERFQAVTALAANLGGVRASSLPEPAPLTQPSASQPTTTNPGFEVAAFEAAACEAAEASVPDAAPDVSVLILDTIGDLAAVYDLADVVFVGGTLVPRGGHNPLEPARFGVPVVIGPSFENFRDVVSAMRAADGILIVKDEEDLTSVLIDLLTNSERAHNLGKRGQSVFEREGGATARSIQALMPLLATSDPFRNRAPRAVAASREVSA